MKNEKEKRKRKKKKKKEKEKRKERKEAKNLACSLEGFTALLAFAYSMTQHKVGILMLSNPIRRPVVAISCKHPPAHRNLVRLSWIVKHSDSKA